jgi:hypothetical protein
MKRMQKREVLYDTMKSKVEQASQTRRCVLIEKKIGCGMGHSWVPGCVVAVERLEELCDIFVELINSWMRRLVDSG